MSASPVQEGDKVSWSWGSGQPSGTAAEVKEGDLTIVSHRGNEITKHGEEGDPAVHVERSGNDVVKKASELNVESHASTSNGTSSESKKDEKEDEKEEDEKEEGEKEENEDEKDESPPAQSGDKRKADEKVDADEKAEKKPAKVTKKQKMSNGKAGPAPVAKKNGEKKKLGRPKSNGGKKPAKEKKVPATGRAERKTRSQSKAD